MNINISNHQKNEYIRSIIEALGMDSDNFFTNVAEGKKFEVTIHHWSVCMFEEWKTVDKAVVVIKKRMVKVATYYDKQDFFTKNTREDVKKYHRVLKELENKAEGIHLAKLEKTEIQKKIAAFVETRLYTYWEIVDFINNTTTSCIHNTSEIKCNDLVPA